MDWCEVLCMTMFFAFYTCRKIACVSAQPMFFCSYVKPTKNKVYLILSYRTHPMRSHEIQQTECANINAHIRMFATCIGQTYLFCMHMIETLVHSLGICVSTKSIHLNIRFLYCTYDILMISVPYSTHTNYTYIINGCLISKISLFTVIFEPFFSICLYICICIYIYIHIHIHTRICT